MYTLLMFLSFFLFLNTLVAAKYDYGLMKKKTISKKAKFFGIGLVRIENGLCIGADNFEGTCYTRQQCASISGGSPANTCASGIGVCCVVQKTCGDVTSYNNTYFVSPNFPTPVTGGSSCTLTIQKCNPDICQVRIDFLAFNLAQPNANGSCIFDAMTVTGGASEPLVICGENSGQHIYVDFNGNSDIQIHIGTSAAITQARSWNFKISQIACDCPTRAPPGCLMYYTSLSGTVRSFNYGTTVPSSTVAPGVAGSRQIANLNYGICIAPQPGYCSIQWSQASGDPYAFTVSGNTILATGNGTVGTPGASVVGVNCTNDFVVIPNPYYANGMPVNSDRFCGNGFPTVTTSSKPFVLTVVTDGSEVTDAGNRGFSLMYMQQLCSSTNNFVA